VASYHLHHEERIGECNPDDFQMDHRKVGDAATTKI